MKPLWLFLLLLLPASAIAAEEKLQLVFSDTPPVDKLVIEPLTPKNTKQTVYTGNATLFLDDGTAIPLQVTRKLKKKKGTWSFKIKSLKKAKPKVSVKFDCPLDFSVISKFKYLKLSGDVGKVIQKDGTKVKIGGDEPKPVVSGDLLGLHDQDLTKAGLTCQASDCHANQMERYAPHAVGMKVENFHYMKAAALSASFFGGRTPESFEDQDCTVCHKRVRLLAASGANVGGTSLYLRKMVDISFCAGCHGPGGPGKPLYK